MSESGSAIRLADLRHYAERPESEFEWEDLLLRLEIMPRALRVELERTKREDAPPILLELNDRELAVQRLLEEVAFAVDPHHPLPARAGSEAVSTGPPAAGPPAPEGSPPDPAPASLDGSDVERFVRLRGRNFAMLQRRGIDVWNWRIRYQADEAATVFQLLSLLAQADVETLSRLRKSRTP